jgi:hypothetical protein
VERAYLEQYIHIQWLYVFGEDGPQRQLGWDESCLDDLMVYLGLIHIFLLEKSFHESILRLTHYLFSLLSSTQAIPFHGVLSQLAGASTNSSFNLSPICVHVFIRDIFNATVADISQQDLHSRLPALIQNLLACPLLQLTRAPCFVIETVI